jgi:hypothetical protein
MDTDPIFVELTIRRLEQFRKHGVTGWQWKSPFPELKLDFNYDIDNNNSSNDKMKQISLF